MSPKCRIHGSLARLLRMRKKPWKTRRLSRSHFFLSVYGYINLSSTLYWSIAAVALRQPCEPSRRVIVVATGLVWIAARSIGVASSTRFHLPQLPAGVSSLVSVASTVMPSRVTPSNLYLFVPILVSFGIVTPAGVAAVPHAPS